jgi:pimeloyl-ACP methyl ester carboxylesterase
MPVSAVRQIEFNARVDITDRVAAITAPTQLVTGRHDQMVPMKLQQQLAEAIPHAKQTILPTAHARIPRRSAQRYRRPTTGSVASRSW